MATISVDGRSYEINEVTPESVPKSRVGCTGNACADISVTTHDPTPGYAYVIVKNTGSRWVKVVMIPCSGLFCGGTFSVSVGPGETRRQYIPNANIGVQVPVEADYLE